MTEQPSNPVDPEDVNAAFRAIHSIKGGAATFGFQDVADLTHVMETLLDKLRRHELTATTGMVDTLLESGDVLEQLLARHRSGDGAAIDSGELVARIGALANGVAAAAPVGAAAAAPVPPAPVAAPGPSVHDVYGRLPATPGCENAPAIGWRAQCEGGPPPSTVVPGRDGQRPGNSGNAPGQRK